MWHTRNDEPHGLCAWLIVTALAGPLDAVAGPPDLLRGEPAAETRVGLKELPKALAGLEEPRSRQEAEALVLSRPNGLPGRLQQLAAITAATGPALRQALWVLEDPALQGFSGRSRAEVFATMQQGWPIIDMIVA